MLDLRLYSVNAVPGFQSLVDLGALLQQAKKGGEHENQVLFLVSKSKKRGQFIVPMLFKRHLTRLAS